MNIIIYALLIAAASLAASWVGHTLIVRLGYSARWIVGLLVGAMMAVSLLSFAAHSKAFRQFLVNKPSMVEPMIKPIEKYRMPTKPLGHLEA